MKTQQEYSHHHRIDSRWFYRILIRTLVRGELHRLGLCRGLTGTFSSGLHILLFASFIDYRFSLIPILSCRARFLPPRSFLRCLNCGLRLLWSCLNCLLLAGLSCSNLLISLFLNAFPSWEFCACSSLDRSSNSLFSYQMLALDGSDSI